MVQFGNDADSRINSELFERIAAVEGLLGKIASDLLPGLRADVINLRNSMAKKLKENLLVEEVAEEMGRSPYTVRRWISEGKLTAIRIRDGGPRGRLLIPRAELDRLVASARGTGVPNAASD